MLANSKLLVLIGWIITSAIAIKNPIITGWNPDGTILRSGKYYYIATSSFEYFPGTPIYRSTDLANWELISHAFSTPETLQLHGVPTGAGGWAPTLSQIDGKFYIAAMTRWTYDPVARVWPRIYYASSTDMINWSNLTWADPWGIDPSLYQDPITNRTYLNLMAPNNNKDRLWGISQCEIDLTSGKCIGDYISLWNGTLPHNSSARPEGPKMYHRNGFYYLLIAEGGTDDLHRASIARSRNISGPWDPAPNNPLLFNGAYGFNNLTVQSTGHATFVEGTDGRWWASFLARRKINGSSPLGRETFLTSVVWNDDGWPVLNNGTPVLLSEDIPSTSKTQKPALTFKDDFAHKTLDPSWYQLRTVYTQNYELNGRSLILKPNVFGLGDRDTPAAILRKQKSLNMTFAATLSPTKQSLGPRMTIGISAYLSEFQHQDLGISSCINSTNLCVYSTLIRNTTTSTVYAPLNQTTIPYDVTLFIRATPLKYEFGYSTVKGGAPTYINSIESSWQAFAPTNWFVFEGNSFALFASGGGEPWPWNGPEVGFSSVQETYYKESIPDFDRW